MSASKVRPNYDLTTPLAIPSQRFKSQAEFDAASPEEQAAALAAWQSQWAARTVPGASPISGTRIVVPSPTAAVDHQAWKGQPPSKSDLDALEDGSWKRY